LYSKQSWVFFLFRHSERLTGTFRSSEDPSIARLVPSTAEDPTAENRFPQAGKGAENTKEKSRQCFTLWEFSKRVFQFLLSFVAYCKKIATKGTLCNLMCPCFNLWTNDMTIAIHEQGFLFCNVEILASLFLKLAKLVKFTLQKQQFLQFLGPRMTRFVKTLCIMIQQGAIYILQCLCPIRWPFDKCEPKLILQEKWFGKRPGPLL
jgi:hypothetical protein